MTFSQPRNLHAEETKFYDEIQKEKLRSTMNQLDNQTNSNNARKLATKIGVKIEKTTF